MSTDPTTHSLLIEIARGAIEAAVRRTGAPPAGDALILREQRGVFVTIRCAGRLRGCIGRINGDEPLATLLPAVAIESATGDPRFPPVSVPELSGLHIEISLLSVPVVITGPAQIEIGRHGLIVSARGRRGLLLPQVATEFGWTADEFLSQACAKASLPHDEWKRDGVRLQTFETEIVGRDQRDEG
jgi:AmmeMemoRadiSam system protein A